MPVLVGTCFLNVGFELLKGTAFLEGKEPVLNLFAWNPDGVVTCVVGYSFVFEGEGKAFLDFMFVTGANYDLFFHG